MKPRGDEAIPLWRFPPLRHVMLENRDCPLSGHKVHQIGVVGQLPKRTRRRNHLERLTGFVDRGPKLAEPITQGKLAKALQDRTDVNRRAVQRKSILGKCFLDSRPRYPAPCAETSWAVKILFDENPTGSLDYPVESHHVKVLDGCIVSRFRRIKPPIIFSSG